MNSLQIALTIFAIVLILYIIIDVIRVIKIKTVPMLPDMGKTPLSPEGVLKIYEFCKSPSLIPEGVDLNEKYILDELNDTFEYINCRYDCSDFWCQLLFRLYKDFNQKLPSKVNGEIKKTLIGFKFWMDMPGDDSMCYFSENHTILFSALEYLIGKEWPDENFPNSGLLGKEHMERGKTRLTYWFDQKFRFGFFEWYSNNYFLEDMVPIAQLIEYGEDFIKELATDALNLMLFDVATHSINNRFCAVSSRMYSDNKASNQFGNKIKLIMDAFFNDDKSFDPLEAVKLEPAISKMIVNLHLCVISMFKKGLYEVPQIIKDIAQDSTTRIIKSSNGLNPKEYKSLGLIGQHDYQITSQFSNETFVNRGFSWNTYKYHKNNGMFTSYFSLPFKFADIGMVRFTRALPILCNILDRHFMPTGITLSRGNVYTYRTKNYMLSTAVNCHVDYNGTQHHVQMANLSEDLNVFTQYPTTENYSGSPGYWNGNRRMPMSVQDESINLTIFRMGKRKRLGEWRNMKMTHSLFPKEKFDEVILEDTRIFGRIGDTFIALLSNQKLQYKPYDKESAKVLISHHDLRLKGVNNKLLHEKLEKYFYKDVFDLCAINSKVKQKSNKYHLYVTELSDASKETYEEFIERIKNNKFISSYENPGVLEYKSKGKEYHLEYKGKFHINGVEQSLEFPRFESEYCTAKRMPDQISIKFNEKSLNLTNKSNCQFL